MFRETFKGEKARKDSSESKDGSFLCGESGEFGWEAWPSRAASGMQVMSYFSTWEVVLQTPPYNFVKTVYVRFSYLVLVILYNFKK